MGSRDTIKYAVVCSNLVVYYNYMGVYTSLKITPDKNFVLCDESV